MNKMNEQEFQMKQRGEDRVWKKIKAKNGKTKSVVQTQLGQSMLFDDALALLPIIRDWIENKTAKVFRNELKDAFPHNVEDNDDDFLLQKILETTLLLAATTRVYEVKKITRHKSILLIKEKVLPNLSFENVWRFVEVIVESSIYFESEKETIYETNRVGTKVNYKCTIDEDILLKLGQEAIIAFFPEPMLTKPIDWEVVEGQIKGGYESYQFELVRINQKYLNYSNYSQTVFDAVNFVQSTRWTINEEVLHAVKSDIKEPILTDFLKTEFPQPNEACKWDLDIKDKKLKLSKKNIEEITLARRTHYDIVELYNLEKRDFESAMGKYRALLLAIGIAQRFVGETIYFPHSFDFRGRIYPLAIGLSPQGSDEIKAMLTYDEGEVLTKDGENWAWAYLTSLHGEDKITFNERIEVGKMLIDADYHEADEPYQFLAHQLELKKFLKDKDYKFKGRIHLDACNSGSQFTSAITNDVKGCRATNVIPTYIDGKLEREDAYLLVRDKTIAYLTNSLKEAKDKDEKELLEFFIDLLNKDGRKICKKPVMVSNYGGSEGGRIEIIYSTLNDMGVERKWVNKKNASVLSKAIGQSIQGVLIGGKAFEKYIQAMNNVVTKNNKPITWTTKDGFKVIHVKNKELKPKQISCSLPSSRRNTTLIKKIYSNDVSSSKMKSAISPNFVHSLDAELLRTTALAMKEEGILQTDWIHDSFGCLPNHVSLMLDITKKTFKKLMEENPLEKLDKELRNQAGESKSALKLLEKIKIPNLSSCKNLFDKLDDSEWFFS